MGGVDVFQNFSKSSIFGDRENYESKGKEQEETLSPVFLRPCECWKKRKALGAK